MSRTGIFLSLVLTLGVLPDHREAAAQASPADEAYLRATAQHFQVPPQEVRILAEWGLPTTEIPVVLFLSRRGGISPDALVSLRQNGASWSDLSARYQIGAGDYHVPVEGAVPDGILARAYERFEATPRSGWNSIRLTDREVVALVNLRFLTESLGIPPGRLLDAAGSQPDFVRIYGSLSARAGG